MCWMHCLIAWNLWALVFFFEAVIQQDESWRIYMPQGTIYMQDSALNHVCWAPDLWAAQSAKFVQNHVELRCARFIEFHRNKTKEVSGTMLIFTKCWLFWAYIVGIVKSPANFRLVSWLNTYCGASSRLQKNTTIKAINQASFAPFAIVLLDGSPYFPDLTPQAASHSRPMPPLLTAAGLPRKAWSIGETLSDLD